MTLTAEDVRLAEEAAAFFQARISRATDPDLRQAFQEGLDSWRRVARANGLVLRLAQQEPVQESLPFPEPRDGAGLRLVQG